MQIRKKGIEIEVIINEVRCSKCLVIDLFPTKGSILLFIKTIEYEFAENRIESKIYILFVFQYLHINEYFSFFFFLLFTFA